jgi:hypothetical protein
VDERWFARGRDGDESVWEKREGLRGFGSTFEIEPIRY